MKNELVRNMEHLVELLHKEWEQSGKTVVNVFMMKSDAEALRKMINGDISLRQELMHLESLSFKETMHYSKECFVLLRLGKKLLKQAEKMEDKKLIKSLALELDKEEWKLFIEMAEYGTFDYYEKRV